MLLKGLKWIAYAAGLLWTVYAFMASVSPNEAAQRTNAWLALPIIRDLPVWLSRFAGSPYALSLTFLVLGCVVGWKVRGSADRPARTDPMRALGTEMVLMGHAIDNASLVGPNHALLARMNLVLAKAYDAGLAIPSGDNVSKDEFSHYFHQVGIYLQEGEVAAAKRVAPRLAKSGSQ